MDADGVDDSSSSSSSPSSTGLRVVVPGREDEGCLAPACGSSDSLASEAAAADPGTMPEACGAVTVVPGTGALEFNSEDVAALLTLALRRVHPFMVLAKRLAEVAEEASWDDQEEDEEALDDRVWLMVQAYVAESRTAFAGPSRSGVSASGTDEQVKRSSGETGVNSAGLFPGTPPCGLPSAARDTDDVEGSEGDEYSSVGCGGGQVDAHGSAVGAAGTDSGVSEGLTVDEALDLLDYVAASRFLAHLLSEPVVASGVSGRRWAHAEHLARQVHMLAQAEEQSLAGIGARVSSEERAEAPVQRASSLGDMLCLGALSDVEGLAVMMAQQSRFAPALEAVLRSELRRAIKRGQGRQRRLKSRLQALHGMPGVMSFPLVKPGCCLLV